MGILRTALYCRLSKDDMAQGDSENRTIEETLDIGWRLLHILPKEELDRIDTKILEKHW